MLTSFAVYTVASRLRRSSFDRRVYFFEKEKEQEAGVSLDFYGDESAVQAAEQLFRDLVQEEPLVLVVADLEKGMSHLNTHPLEFCSMEKISRRDERKYAERCAVHLPVACPL